MKNNLLISLRCLRAGKACSVAGILGAALTLNCCTFALLTLLCVVPGVVHSEVLVADTIWEGEVLVEDDILVPGGVTLTVKKGTRVLVKPAESTKTDPEYMSSMAEITIRGRLVVEGTSDNPVMFQVEASEGQNGSWAGIIIDGGNAQLVSTVIQDANTGVWIVSGTVALRDSTLTSNRYGLVAQREKSEVNVTRSRITANDYGLVSLNGAVIKQKETTVQGNLKMDFHSTTDTPPAFSLQRYKEVTTDSKPVELVDKVLLGDTIWQGRIQITGQVRVPVNSRLTILPGTIIEFTKKDTNGDGIGESGLMLQGVLLAKGTAKQPIFFRSAEPDKKRGDWDAINIISSDGVRNIIEYCQFEDAYRGLHFHFSNVIMQHSVLVNNYRGMQFQESTVELRENSFYHNNSAVQARDSEIVLAGNFFVNNVFGTNFLQSHLTVQDNTFGNNLDFGLKIREGFPSLTGNIFNHNRYGLMFSDTTYGSVIGNLMAGNSETGLSIRAGENMEIKGNFIQGNGLSGISVRDTAANIDENHISGNGERGIGVVSFIGEISNNTILDNGQYAIAVEDGSDVTAPRNWYGGTQIEPIIFDRADDSSRGKVDYLPVLEEPSPITWPLAKLPFDVTWSGKIRVPQTVFVPVGTRLDIQPGSNILFAKDAGMYIRGDLSAQGTTNQRIRFTALDGIEPNSWGEIRIEHSAGSGFANCDFEYAFWALHSHFNTLTVTGCTFKNNFGGMRFRSGPHLIKNSLFSDNAIGLRAFRANVEISNNSITRNGKGIFVREKGGGVTIRGNNISENIDWSIWVGDFNTDDIQATGNWWGVDDPAETIYDARRDPGIGTVLFEPVLNEPLDIFFNDPGQ